MKYLIVVAHPDDETLGCGASMRKWSQNGEQVDVCIMCTEAKARAFRPKDNELDYDMNESTKFLGVHKIYEGSFPNIEMNNSTHLSLVQFIEKAIIDSKPDVIVTHHPSDTNNDHMHTSMACQAAVRLFQRKPEVKPMKEVWFMEVLSSTEWSVNTAMNAFRPNTYVEIGADGIKAKIDAMHMYRDVMRPYPHPRSDEGIRGLATFRGGQAGVNYAEAFECVLRRITE